MRIDGVSEETNADGEVTSTFEYFRQPEEELESGIGTADIRPDVADLSEDMVRSPPFCSTRSMCVAPDVVHAPLRWQANLVKSWQRHWVLIKATGSAPYSTTTSVSRTGATRAAIWEVETNSASATTKTYTVNRATGLFKSALSPIYPLLISAPTKPQGWS
eukprot:scaffold52959_cov59-Phaeocystis_antarctica.AAC.8